MKNKAVVMVDMGAESSETSSGMCSLHYILLADGLFENRPTPAGVDPSS